MYRDNSAKDRFFGSERPLLGTEERPLRVVSERIAAQQQYRFFRLRTASTGQRNPPFLTGLPFFVLRSLAPWKDAAANGERQSRRNV